jgi:hypothetical protein
LSSSACASASFAHLLDFVLGETAAGGDGDLLLLAGAEVLGAHVQDAVGIDVERHFDLRHAARRGRNVGEMELADGLVVARQLAFALQHVISTPGWLSLAVEKISDLRVGIVVLRSISLVNTPPKRLDAERQRGHVEQEHVLDFALEHAALNAAPMATTSSGFTP